MNDNAYAVEWVAFRYIFDGFSNSPYAWCSDRTPPHDVLEGIEDENGDGSTVDNLEEYLRARGTDPLPKHIKEALERREGINGRNGVP